MEKLATWSNEETEELRDLLKLPSTLPSSTLSTLPSLSSPLLPVTAFARDFPAVGVFT